MERREGRMTSIRDVIEKNIQLDTHDPIILGGFTQLPNFVLKDSKLSLGAKVTYAMFLSYAWHNEFCFPGQDKLAEHMGMSRTRVNEFVKELERAGLMEIQRRGQGQTNVYKIKFVVRKTRFRKS
jgi:hypothetical protein